MTEGGGYVEVSGEDLHLRGLCVSAVGKRAFAATLLALALAGWSARMEGRILLGFAVLSSVLFYLWMLGVRGIWRGLRGRRYGYLIGVVGLLAGLGVYVWFALWGLRPGLLPQRGVYDFVANRQVTERLVDPELMKVERWTIGGQEREVLFVHPTAAGSTALVYPVRVGLGTTLRAYLAMAPEAWGGAGDGVVFSVYVEDEAGMHLVYGRYVDAKHHEMDRRWVPLEVDLSRFRGKVVRVIMAVGSGPAGDDRYDWAGWGEPRLERPVWP